jgi:glycosyltransferase involved in cell wall biosynthesis
MCAVSASFRGAARRGAVTLCADGPVPLFAFLAGLGFFRGVVTVFGMVPKVNRGSVIHWLRTKIIGHAVKRRRLRVVCETETVAEFWRLSGGGNAVSVIPYALESVGSPINRDDARKSLGISPEEPLVLLFGIHREDKDYKTVILAAKSLAASPLLLFAGKSLSAPSPSRLCADAGYSRYLAIDEFIPRDKLPLFFRASDVIVLPYPADFERGSGLVIEACSYGCPIVASSGGYLERFVRSNDIGETYEAGNPLSLCAALTRALDSERQSAIRARMPRIAEDHSMRKLVNSYIVSFSLLNDAGKRITT